jgi:hypothetical protein
MHEIQQMIAQVAHTSVQQAIGSKISKIVSDGAKHLQARYTNTLPFAHCCCGRGDWGHALLILEKSISIRILVSIFEHIEFWSFFLPAVCVYVHSLLLLTSMTAGYH